MTRETPCSDDARAVRNALVRVARRLWLFRALHAVLRSAAFALVVVIAVLTAHALALLPDPRGRALALTAAMLAAGGALPALRRVGLGHAAAAADRVFELHERLTTAIETAGATGPAEQLLARDAVRSLARLDLRGLPTGAFGREAALVVGGLTITAALWIAPAGHAPEKTSPAAGPVSSGAVEATTADVGDHGTTAAERRGLVAALREARRAETTEPPAGDAGEAGRSASTARSAPTTTADPTSTADRSAAPTATPDVSPTAHARGSARARSDPAADRHGGEGDAASGTERAHDPEVVTSGGRTVSAFGAGGATATGGTAASDESAARRSATDDNRARSASASSRVGSAGGLARAGLPAGLRAYVARYFERLRADESRQATPTGPRSEPR